MTPQRPDECECPFCFESIKKQAIKCKHCGSMLTDCGQQNKDDASHSSSTFSGEEVQEILQDCILETHTRIVHEMPRVQRVWTFGLIVGMLVSVCLIPVWGLGLVLLIVCIGVGNARQKAAQRDLEVLERSSRSDPKKDGPCADSR